MIYPRDITTEAEAAVLEHADRLAAVIGTTEDGRREPVAVLPGRRRLEVAIGAWSTQVQAPTAADAVRAASSGDQLST